MCGRNRVHMASIRNTPRVLAAADQFLGLAPVEGERLLHQHGLARLDRRQGARVVGGVGRGDVHGVDVVGREHRGLVAVGAGRAHFGERSASARAAVRGADRDQLTGVGQPQVLREVPGDAAGADDRPAQRFGHEGVS